MMLSHRFSKCSTSSTYRYKNGSFLPAVMLVLSYHDTFIANNKTRNHKVSQLSVISVTTVVLITFEIIKNVGKNSHMSVSLHGPPNYMFLLFKHACPTSF